MLMNCQACHEADCQAHREPQWGPLGKNFFGFFFKRCILVYFIFGAMAGPAKRCLVWGNLPPTVPSWQAWQTLIDAEIFCWQHTACCAWVIDYLEMLVCVFLQLIDHWLCSLRQVMPKILLMLHRLWLRKYLFSLLDVCCRVFTRSSKRPALWLLEVCWTFAGSCEHSIVQKVGIQQGWCWKWLYCDFFPMLCLFAVMLMVWI